MKKLFQSLVIILLFFLVFSWLISSFGSTSLNQVSRQKVDLTTALEKITSQEAEKVVVKPSQIEVTLVDGSILIANKETNVSFPEILKDFEIPIEATQNLKIEVKEESGFVYWLAILLPIIIPIIFFVYLFSSAFKKANQGAAQIFSFSRSNIRLFSPTKDRITFKDVAGLKEAKEELQEVVEFLKNPKKFETLGARIPRGVLLVGPTGVGKTLLARAVAGEANVPFFHISGSEFVELFVGVGAGRVRDAFNTAKKAAPSILFIDEIDAIGRERGSGIGGGHDEREQTLNQILVEMDGFERDTRVIVISATNRPDILDPALLRPGRFDRRIVLDLPDIKEREEILKIHSQGKKLAPDVNLREIAERTPGFSGADLANLTNEAAILAARRNKKSINQIEFLEAIEKVILGPERKSRVLSSKEKEITAYHEGGHALVSFLTPEGGEEVRKVSIISRGRAGGYTMRMPKEEKYLKTRSEFLADIKVLLGGYVAEELKYKEISTGAANDLREASDIARALVTKYGMSKDLGPVAFGKTEDLVFLGRELTSERDYSEETAQKIDKEVMEIIKNCYHETKKILKDNFNKLEKIAQKLIEKETLEKEEIEELVKEEGG
ncbi:MAG TPA: ATP-dependent zinc metalloprotease FtsH [Candidatus Paceibacterota bacterium]|nr:ATP-dependent zinc metalloprotease FtsH [Candidatus Paceibacterota bacterium]